MCEPLKQEFHVTRTEACRLLMSREELAAHCVNVRISETHCVDRQSAYLLDAETDGARLSLCFKRLI